MLFENDNNINTQTITIINTRNIVVRCLQHLLHSLKVNPTLEVPLKPHLGFQQAHLGNFYTTPRFSPQLTPETNTTKHTQITWALGGHSQFTINTNNQSYVQHTWTKKDTNIRTIYKANMQNNDTIFTTLGENIFFSFALGSNGCIFELEPQIALK